MRFLEGYRQLAMVVKNQYTEDILKGKQPAVLTSRIRTTRVPVKPPDKPWCKPPTGWVKLTVDGSFSDKDQSAGLGMVLRNEEGQPIFASCRYMDDCLSPLESELRACADGLDLAIHRSQLPIIVETDWSQLVSMVTSPGVDRSPFLNIVSDIKNLSENRECIFVKVERSQVRVIHHLTSLARVERHSETWLSSGPVDLLHTRS
jgi:ribonuclease HI